MGDKILIRTFCSAYACGQSQFMKKKVEDLGIGIKKIKENNYSLWHLNLECAMNEYKDIRIISLIICRIILRRIILNK